MSLNARVLISMFVGMCACDECLIRFINELNGMSGKLWAKWALTSPFKKTVCGSLNKWQSRAKNNNCHSQPQQSWHSCHWSRKMLMSNVGALYFHILKICSEFLLNPISERLKGQRWEENWESHANYPKQFSNRKQRPRWWLNNNVIRLFHYFINVVQIA